MSALTSKLSIFRNWDREKLSIMTEKILPRSYRAGSTIFKEGERLSTVMLIKSGIVRLVRTLKKPKIVLSPRTPQLMLSRGSAVTPRESNSFGESTNIMQPLLHSPLDPSPNRMGLSPRAPVSPRSSKSKSKSRSNALVINDWNPPLTASSDNPSAPHTIHGMDPFSPSSPSTDRHSLHSETTASYSDSYNRTVNSMGAKIGPFVQSPRNLKLLPPALIVPPTDVHASVTPRGTWLLDEDMHELYSSTCLKKFGGRGSRGSQRGRLNRFDLIMKQGHNEKESANGSSNAENVVFTVAELLSGQTFGEISVLVTRPTTAAAALAAAEQKCIRLYFTFIQSRLYFLFTYH